MVRTKQIISILIVVTLRLAVASDCAVAGENNPSRTDDPQSVESNLPAALVGVGFDQHLNAQVPLDLQFRNEQGETVRLRKYFGSKPVVLVLAYFQCPRLCTLEINNLVQGLLEIDLNASEDFEVVIVSFDPREDWRLAASKKDAYVPRYGRAGAEQGWHFLTGEPAPIHELAQAVGFRYRFDDRQQQYVHASGIMILTPEGKISRYLYGIRYAGRDLRLGLVEASDNKIGSPVDQILLYCFQYDAALGRYTARIMIFIRMMGVLIMGGIVAFVVGLRRIGRRRAEKIGAPSS